METITTSDWNTIFTKTLNTCHHDEQFMEYSAREKMLAFVFTFLQNLNNSNPPAFLSLLDKTSYPFLQKSTLLSIKNDFMKFSDELLLDANNSGEVQARLFIAKYYDTLLWNAFVSILYFWKNDTSENKENTDVMVEKTVHFTFDLLAPNALDSGIDLIQNFLKLRKK